MSCLNVAYVHNPTQFHVQQGLNVKTVNLKKHINMIFCGQMILTITNEKENVHLNNVSIKIALLGRWKRKSVNSYLGICVLGAEDSSGLNCFFSSSTCDAC